MVKVAFCHDWLVGMRGGERVLEALLGNHPNAPVYSLLHDPQGISPKINAHPVSTSPLQHIPGIEKKYRWLLPLMPWAIQHLKPDPDTQLVVSTSHCVAKGIPIPQGARHLCYCFTPMRYAWLFGDEYIGKNPLKRVAASPVLALLRNWDRRTAANVDLFVAISHHVRARIQRFYGREAQVVYPPADTDFFTPVEHPSADYDVIISALVPYKRLELAVEAYNHLGTPLRIVGTGTEYHRLRGMSQKNIVFMGRLNDAEVRDQLRNARLLIFPGEEDFGIVPVEAMACGRPVVAFSKGGVTETVVDGQTGLFFNEPNPASLAAAVTRAASQSWSANSIRSHAEHFSIPRFLIEMEAMMQKALREPRFNS